MPGAICWRFHTELSRPASPSLVVFFIAAHANTLPLLFFANYRLVAARTVDPIRILNFRVSQALKMQVALALFALRAASLHVNCC